MVSNFGRCLQNTFALGQLSQSLIKTKMAGWTCLRRQAFKLLQTQGQCGDCYLPRHFTKVVDSFRISSGSRHKIIATSWPNLAPIRQFSNDASPTVPAPATVCQQLDKRSLIEIAGEDTLLFLQGLITNDIRHLETQPSMYAMLLNVQGRVLYDFLIYKSSKDFGEPIVLVECDKWVVPELLDTLKKYKIKKKVRCADVGDRYKAWAVLPDQPPIVPGASVLGVQDPSQVIACASDPRVKDFGWRLILPDGVDALTVLKNATRVPYEEFYTMQRYRSGIGEGTADLPPGNCFPLECNAVFLNGVSFNKGCYIGQELTARTHHTGVTRKRLMPLEFTSVKHTAAVGDTVESTAGRNCGKVRSISGKYGLGLLRLPNTINKGQMVTKDAHGNQTAEVNTHVPSWWWTDSDELLKQMLTPNKI